MNPGYVIELGIYRIMYKHTDYGGVDFLSNRESVGCWRLVGAMMSN